MSSLEDRIAADPWYLANDEYRQYLEGQAEEQWQAEVLAFMEAAAVVAQWPSPSPLEVLL